MKRLLFIIAPILLLGSPVVYSQAGKNCFNTQFTNNATSLDTRNAYLLGYLCTMSYADYLRYLYTPVYSDKSAFIKSIRDDDDKFETEFADKLGYLFTATTAAPVVVPPTKLTVSSPVVTNKTLTNATSLVTEPAVSFEFIHKCNTSGYDPEALVISTPTTIYIIFRGTDRVSCTVSPSGFQYQWAEWMASDFKFLKRDATVINPQVQGQVHRGMVESLLSQNSGDKQNFADELASTVSAKLKNKVTGAVKKVWIAGHSLGGAHAQLFAMFLKFNYNITAQGLYLYEAPHPGDATFTNQLNSAIGKTHIQRFEFGDDPICTLPPQVFFFGRAGSRNYFKDYNSAAVKTEQIAGIDDFKILCALGNLPAEQIPQTAHFVFPPLCPGSTCFHHPTFILQAIRHQLPSSELPSLPPAVPLPVAGDNCIQGDLTKAENNDLINNGATAIESTVTNTANAIVQVAFQAGNILNNLLGTGLAEGKYKIACYGFKNNTKKYLHWNGTSNSQLSVSTSGSVFNLAHKISGGYQLYISNGNMASDVTFNIAGFPTGTEHTNNIIMKPKDLVIGDEETWYFFEVPNKTNTYVMLNWNTQKVLEVNDKCLSDNACDVNEAKASSNEPTQVWILEKQN